MKRRIAVFADRYPPDWGGGVASAHCHLARLLASEGHDVRVFTFFDSLAMSPPVGETGIVRSCLAKKWHRPLRRINNLLFRLIEPGTAAYQTLDILLRAKGAFGLQGDVTRFAPEIAIFPDHGAPGLWIDTPPDCRRVMIAHHNPSRFEGLPGIECFSKRDIALAGWLENRMLRRMDLVIAPSRYMADVFATTRRFTGRLEIIPNLLDPAFMKVVAPSDVRAELDLPAGAPMVYVPGGGNKFKGARFLPQLVEALAAQGLPFGMFVSGAVPEGFAKSWPNQARLFAPGPLPADKTLSYVAACSFALSPTLVENYSMALLEAVSLGLPCVAFDVGGNGEIVKDGINGHLAPAFDVARLGERAARLLDRDACLSLSHSTLRDAQSRLSYAAWRAPLLESLGCA